MIVSNAPVGLFDSGVGGLTVFRALQRELPRESLLYVGDTARVPYGNKSAVTVQRYAAEIAGFLSDRKIKLLVVACNTASAVALDSLRSMCPFPVVGMIEPGVNRALAVSRSKRIGVIGTAATIASDAYARALKAKERKVQIFSSICGMFVPLVEEGWCDGEIPLDIVRKYLAPIKQERIDALILACTHYPLLTSLIQEVVGPDITLVDSGEAAAKVVALELQKLNILAPEGTVAESHIYITDVAPSFYNMAHRILGDVLPTVTALTL